MKRRRIKSTGLTCMLFSFIVCQSGNLHVSQGLFLFGFAVIM